jgi:hypothetical protein
MLSDMRGLTSWRVHSGRHLLTLPRASHVHVMPVLQLILAASNIIEQRYNVTEGEATRQASYLLAGSLVLYPIVRIPPAVAATLLILLTVWLPCRPP